MMPPFRSSIFSAHGICFIYHNCTCDSCSLPIKDTEPWPKKQKVDHPTFSPPKFWDNLSKRGPIPLTKNALRELNRRNSRIEPREGARPPSVRRSSRLAAQRQRSITPKRVPVIPVNELKKFASHGGPDLTDLRGYCPPNPIRSEMPSSTQSSLGRRKRGMRSSENGNATANTKSTRSTGPYDRAFQQHLIDHGIYPDRYRYPDGRVPSRPDNLEDIRLALRQPRPSLSPSQFSEGIFEAFQLADADAAKESQVVTDVIPFIEGNVRDRKCMGRQIPFNNFDHLTDGTLAAASPDIYYGSRPEQLNRQIREELSNLIVPSTQDDLPVAPNFFVEVKGRDGTAAVANRQINYDTALGERGQHALLAYLEPAQPNNIHNQAHTLGCTYVDGTLKMYATHTTQSSTQEGRKEHVMTQIKAWALTGDSETFREGAIAYRNGRDWAEQQRDRAIKKANEKVSNQKLGIASQECNLGIPFPSQGTVDAAGRANQAPSNHKSNATPLECGDSSEDELSLGQPPARRVKSTGKILKTPGLSSRPQQNLQDGYEQMRSVETISDGSRTALAKKAV